MYLIFFSFFGGWPVSFFRLSTKATARTAVRVIFGVFVMGWMKLTLGANFTNAQVGRFEIVRRNRHLDILPRISANAR
jgi:hypothetical protein